MPQQNAFEYAPPARIGGYLRGPVPCRRGSRPLRKIGLILAVALGLFPINHTVFAEAGLRGNGGDAGKSAPAAAETPVSTPEVRVTYVGNAGFLIAIDDKKILIDALFSGFPGGYILPQEIQDKMALGQPPFDGIDLVLATHSHGDHFESGLVRRFLANNRAAVFGSTPQAAASLSGFPGRVIAFQPKKSKPACEDIRGIRVEAIYLSHGAPAAGRAEVINYGYLVTVNGITLFHTGDIDASFIGFEAFRSLRLPEKKIDLAFLQHFYLSDVPAERKLIREGIAARYIIATHYHYTDPPLNPEAVLRNYPDAVLFKAELQSWAMPRPKRTGDDKEEASAAAADLPYSEWE